MSCMATTHLKIRVQPLVEQTDWINLSVKMDKK